MFKSSSSRHWFLGLAVGLLVVGACAADDDGPVGTGAPTTTVATEATDLESPETTPRATAPVVTTAAAPTQADVLAAAQAVSAQVSDAQLVGFETVWEISTTIPETDEGYEAAKLICEAVRTVVEADEKNVTVKSDDGSPLSTGTYFSDCVYFR